MRRVLVTGVTGFIGQHILDPLRERGFEIYAIGRSRPCDRQLVFHEVDVLNVDRTRLAVAAVKASHLVHLAWYAEPGQVWHSPNNLDWVGASLNLLRVFAENGGKRAVIGGTCAEYHWGTERFQEEETPCRPATLYGASKDALRRILMAYSNVASLSVAWGRIFFLYGPGEKQGRLVSDAIRLLLAGQAFPTSHGLQRRDFMHVSDVAGAFAALADSEVSGPVNIGSGTAAPVRSILEQIACETGHPDLIVFGAKPLSASDPSVIEADVTRLTREIGYRPKYDLNRGITETVAWWRTQLI
jgi:nucleoside-diphosphate-sugar epimerase